jgi:phage tail sheath gpL-like
MPVSFNQIPQNWRMPLYWVEVDPSQAGIPIFRNPALLVGQMFTADVVLSDTDKGTATPDVPVAIGSLEEAKLYFGEGSMLERMFAAFFRCNAAQEVWGLPLAPPTGVAAHQTITVATPATDAGLLNLYIAGQRIQVQVNALDSVDTIAGAIVTVINDTPTLPVTAAAAAAIITLTCKWVGTTGNDINIQDSYLGKIGGEILPPGVTLTYAGSFLASGTGAPTFTNAIANIGDEVFDFVSLPFTDTSSVQVWTTEYGFGDIGRWGWLRELYGMIFSAHRDIYANLMTYGPGQNYGVISILGVESKALSPVWEWCSAYCARGARAFTNDPARPLQTLELIGIVPAKKHERFTLTECNSLSGVGIATQRVNPNNVPMIMRETTTYQLNVYGSSDDAYELLTTLATLQALLRNQKAAITSKFPRCKLADDGTRFGPGQAIVTPKIIKAELVAQYRIDEWNGLVENATAFKNALIVERDSNNPNRVNVLYPPDLINQLRVFAVLAQFRLQYDRGPDMTTV